MKQLYYLTKSNRKDKRFTITTPDNKKIHFGSKTGSTYIDHRNAIKRRNYILRHSRLNEDWNDLYSAGNYAFRLLWGMYDNLNDNIKDMEKKFKIKIVNLTN